MMFSFFLLMGQGSSDSAWINLVFMGAIFLVMYMLIIRPQSKKQKELQFKISELKKGDRVVTSGGMLGTVLNIYDHEIKLEIDSNVKATFLKTAVTDVNPEKKADK